MEAGFWRRVPLLGALLWLAGACGSSDNEHADSGYGANKVVPGVINCADFCARDAECFEQLCNEDTASTRYTGLER